MSDKPTYYELLKHPLWQRKRLEILNRAEFRCERCEATEKTLSVHHTYYERGLKPWEYPDDSLHSLCDDCHARAQDNMTLLHQRIGQLSLYQIEQLYGYASGLLAISYSREDPIDVVTEAIAHGVADAYDVTPADVMFLAREGSVDGAQLEKLWRIYHDPTDPNYHGRQSS